MYKKDSLRKMVADLHSTVYGSVEDRFNETNYYDGYYEDALKIYTELIKDLLRK